MAPAAQETFSDLQPIPTETFSDLTPISAPPGVPKPPNPILSASGHEDLLGDPGTGFGARTGTRIAQNLWHGPAQTLEAVPGVVSHAIETRGADQPGGIPPAELPAAAWHGIKNLAGQYKDPANLAGDVLSVGIAEPDIGMPKNAEYPAASAPRAATPRVGTINDLATVIHPDLAQRLASLREGNLAEAAFPHAAKRVAAGKRLLGMESPPAAAEVAAPVRPAPRPGPAAPPAVPADIRQGWALRHGGRSAPPEPSAALGEIPVQAQAEAAPPAALKAPPVETSPTKLGEELETSLGGRGLVPGVSLRNQPAAQAAAAGKLPQGFTPVESSALKGYKYDPATREFESVTSGGQHYIHGDVSPEDVKGFENAESKGKAWQQIRENPLVAKVVNGKRVNVVKPAAARSASPEDLTSVLQQSLDQVKAQKAGVQTSASPSDLAERWGVNEKSLTSGRQQTRGMSAEATEADVRKLTARYKKGAPVDPVIETRDAQNNIVSVDGRARVIAAQRAGVKRIPIMIRRIGVEVPKQ